MLYIDKAKQYFKIVNNNNDNSLRNKSKLEAKQSVFGDETVIIHGYKSREGPVKYSKSMLSARQCASKYITHTPGLTYLL